MLYRFVLGQHKLQICLYWCKCSYCYSCLYTSSYRCWSWYSNSYICQFVFEYQWLFRPFGSNYFNSSCCRCFCSSSCSCRQCSVVWCRQTGDRLRYSLADGVEVDGDACAVVLAGSRLVVRLTHVSLRHCGTRFTHLHTTAQCLHDLVQRTNNNSTQTHTTSHAGISALYRVFSFSYLPS